MYTNLLCFHCFDLIIAFKCHWFQRYSVFCLLDCHFILGDNFLEILFHFSIQKAIWKKKKHLTLLPKVENGYKGTPTLRKSDLESDL